MIFINWHVLLYKLIASKVSEPSANFADSLIIMASDGHWSIKLDFFKILNLRVFWNPIQ
jgi:hypothetical protein